MRKARFTKGVRRLKRAIQKLISRTRGSHSSTLSITCASVSSIWPHGRPALSQWAFLKLIPVVCGTNPSIFGDNAALNLRREELGLAEVERVPCTSSHQKVTHSKTRTKKVDFREAHSFWQNKKLVRQ